MHGNEWRAAYHRLNESSPSSPRPTGTVPSTGNGAGAASQQWLRVDTVGNVSAIQADKQHLVQELSIPFRDLRTLDPSVRIPYPIALFVRLKAIIVNFEALRMIITHDQAFVLSVPVPGESLLVGQSAKLQGTFVKHLRQCIRGHAAQHSTPFSNVDSGSSQPAAPEHAQLPFELRCLEAALETALSVMAGETGALELHTAPLLNRASQKVARGELELLRDSRSALSKLTSRVTKLKQELETVLGSESEMEMLYLARRAAGQGPAQPPEEQQQQQEGEDPQPAPRRSSRPSHAASAPPAAEEHKESEDEAEELPAATGDAEEQPQQFAEDGQPRRRSCADSWKHSVRQVTRMLSSLHTMQSLQQSTLQSDKSTWALANLLDSNLMHCEHLLQRLEVLKDHLLSVEKFINAELDHRRNELVSLDIFVTALMSMFAFVSMIGAIFGMNLTNGWESSHVVFLLATWGSVAGAALVFGSIMWFAWSKHLLLIPDSNSMARDVD